jgi:hypothetical protein
MTDAWSPPKPESTQGSGHASLTTISWVLVGILGLAAAGQVFVTGCSAALAFVFPQDLAHPEYASGAGMLLLALLGLGSVATIGLIVLGIPAWVYWHYRAAANLGPLGRVGLSDTPGWHAGWWFVPIANLWKPYGAMKDLYKASDPDVDDDEWFASPVPGLFPLWWFCWIAGNILSNLSSRLAQLDDPTISVWGELVATPLNLAATALYLLWVYRITRRQQQLASRETT